MYEILTPFNLKEGELSRGFNPEGLFLEHLEYMRYNNIFTRIVEGTGDRNPNTPMNKDKHLFNDNLVTEVSTNTQIKNRTRQQGKYTANMQYSYVPHSHRISFSTERKWELNVCRGENNEGCARGDDGEYLPLVDIEI